MSTWQAVQGSGARFGCMLAGLSGLASYTALTSLAPRLEGGMKKDSMSLPTCLCCGVCCFSQLEDYVRVTGADHLRLGDAADRLVRFDGNRATMRMFEGHCLALVLKVERQEFFCDCYATRPQICRDLGRGSPACHGERHTKGERPRQALEQARLKPR